MSTETESFEINRIEWHYKESHENTSSRNPPKRIRVGVAAMSVRCKVCGTVHIPAKTATCS